MGWEIGLVLPVTLETTKIVATMRKCLDNMERMVSLCIYANAKTKCLWDLVLSEVSGIDCGV